MSLYKSKSTHQPVRSFLSFQKSQKSPKENIQVSNNTISILDDNNQLVEQIVPNAKILPLNTTHQQINQRSLIESLDDVIRGLNLTVFYIGSSFSGKQNLFDGTKQQNPLIYYFVERLISTLKKQFNRFQIRLRMMTIINEKVYDCLSDNKHCILRLKFDKWEGVETSGRTIPFQTLEDFKVQLQRGLKQKNKLVLEMKDLYTSYLGLQIVHRHHQNDRITIVNKISVIEIPGVQVMSNSHSTIKIKESSLSTKSLLGFITILNEVSNYPDSTAHFQCSSLTFLLKEILGANSIVYSYFTLNVNEIEPSLTTLKLLKPFDNILQYPIVNQSRSFGLIKRYRLSSMNGNNKEVNNENEIKQIKEEMANLQAQEDYKRIMQKYLNLKQKLSQALKSKSEAQLELIKCQQQKLQMGKALVQIQIDNTKLIEKLQNKDYENGKKLLNVQSNLAQKQMSYQQCKEKISELSEGLNQALETKRDLEVEFIALKRNFLILQKQNKQLKEDNQSLSLDLINISRENDKIKQEILNGGKFPERNSMINQMQISKLDEEKREKRKLEQSVSYLKSEVQRYKKELIQFQLNGEKKKERSDGFGKNYQRIQLQNQKLQLLNKNKLSMRKIEQYEQKVGFYQEENRALEEENRKIKIKSNKDTENYRLKLEQLVKNTNSEAIVKELRQNFNRKDSENLDKINSYKRQISSTNATIIMLKSYITELKALLDEWAPKGIDIPSIKKYQAMNFTTDEKQNALDELKIRNIKLQEQVRRMKENTNGQYKESRVSQQIKILRGSGAEREIQNLRMEKNNLTEQNRRLTVLLKDGNKMDLNILKKENENLRKENENLKGKTSSISPSSSDQKLVFYQKHLKILEKERSELLSRCVVAEEQLKNVLAKIGKSTNF